MPDLVGSDEVKQFLNIITGFAWIHSISVEMRKAAKSTRLSKKIRLRSAEKPYNPWVRVTAKMGASLTNIGRGIEKLVPETNLEYRRIEIVSHKLIPLTSNMKLSIMGQCLPVDLNRSRKSPENISINLCSRTIITPGSITTLKANKLPFGVDYANGSSQYKDSSPDLPF